MGVAAVIRLLGNRAHDGPAGGATWATSYRSRAGRAAEWDRTGAFRSTKPGGIPVRMSWRDRGWRERPPRPTLAKLPREALERLRARAGDFVQESLVLRELVEDVQLARGRLYLWREPEDLMARITPLGPRSMLLEAPRGSSWTEEKRGQLVTVLKTLESDTIGTFHGLGALAMEHRDGGPPAQVRLYRDLGVPVRVLAEPGYWYSMHRTPVIAEISDAKDRALVRFVAHSLSGSFHGTCLYARRNGEWDCYTIKPSASKTIASAEA